MKKISTIFIGEATNSRLITLLLAFFLLVPGIIKAEIDPLSGLEYSKSGEEITIEGIGRSSTDVVIPEEIEGLPVVSISRTAFFCEGITSIKIASTVKAIGKMAFSINNFTEIVIPSSVTEIGEYVFSDCELLKTITFESSNISRYDSFMLDKIKNLEVIYVPKGMKEAYSNKFKEYADIIQEKDIIPTSISSTKTFHANTGSDTLYSIDGKTVSKEGSTANLAKGIYIKNGKKIVIK